MVNAEENTLFGSILKLANNCLSHVKIFLLIVLLPTFSMFVAVTWVLDPVYKAEAIVTPPDSKSSMSGTLGKFLEGASGLSSMTSLLGDDRGANIVWTFFNSWELHDKVIEKFGLETHYEFEKKKKYFHADVLKKFRKNFSLETNEENMFYLTFEDKDCDLAVEVLQFMLREADSMYNAFKTSLARQSRTYMENRLEEVMHTVDSLQAKFAEFQTKNNFYDPEVQLESTVKYLASLQAERDAIAVEVAYEKSAHGTDSKRYGELSNRLRALDESIRLASQGKKSDMGVLSLKKSPELMGQYLRLENEVKIQISLYKFLRQQSEQLYLEEVNRPTNLVVLQAPWKNEKRVFPKRGMMLIFAGILSSVLAVFVCSLLEFFKNISPETEFASEWRKFGSFFRRKK